MNCEYYFCQNLEGENLVPALIFCWIFLCSTAFRQHGNWGHIIGSTACLHFLPASCQHTVGMEN